MKMPEQKNENKSYEQTLNSYDPLIWRKDVNVIAIKFPNKIVLDSGYAENPDKIVNNILGNKGMFI
jgi:hypothetical protein